MDASKQSAVAAIASDLRTDERHTSPAPENSAIADLFRAIDDEASGFDGATIQPVKRGRGRPAGSISRTTKQLQAYLQSRGYRDPAEFLASVVSMDTVELAGALSVKVDGKTIAADVTDVLKVQIRAAEALLPYFHQKLPVQIEHKGEGARPLIVLMDGAETHAIQRGDDGTMSVHDLVIDQQVSDEAAIRSHETRSHDDD